MVRAVVKPWCCEKWPHHHFNLCRPGRASSLQTPRAPFQPAEQQCRAENEGPTPRGCPCELLGCFLALVHSREHLHTEKEHPQVQEEVLVLIFKKVWLLASFIINFPCSMSAVKHLKIKVRLHSRKAKPNKIFCRKYDNLNFFF